MRVWKVALAGVLGVLMFTMLALGGILAGGPEGPPEVKERTHLGSSLLEVDHVLPPAEEVIVDQNTVHVLTCRVIDVPGEPIAGASCIFHFIGEALELGTDATGRASSTYDYGTFGSLEAAADGYHGQIDSVLIDRDMEIEFRLETVAEEPKEGPKTLEGDQQPSEESEPGEGGAQIAPDDSMDRLKPLVPHVCKDTLADPCPTHGPVGLPDRFYPNMSWAVLKDGRRFAVAWEDYGNAYTGKLVYSLNGAPNRTVSEGFNRDVHLIVVDLADKDTGGRLEFNIVGKDPDGNITASDRHGVHVGNAMTAWDGQKYTVNLLVLANEGPHRGNLEGGVTAYASALNDATDGYVQVGAILVMYDIKDQADGGRIKGCSGPECVTFYDVVFTADENPGAAGTAQLDGIQSLTAKIVMNQNAEAPGPNSGPPNPGAIREVKSVLTHEFGHYAFGAMDFYCGGAIPVVGVFANSGCAAIVPDCDVAATGVSIMGASRTPTEFDDEFNRCPPENEKWHEDLNGYYPTWTRMNQPNRFPEIPDRFTLPDPGPLDAGPFHLHTYDFKQVPLPLP